MPTHPRPKHGSASHAAGLAAIIASVLIVGCHDYLTSPRGPRLNPGISPRLLSDTVGSRNVRDIAIYDQTAEPNYGGAPSNEAWTFNYPTIYEVKVAGEVQQVANFPGFGNNSTWGPLGNPNTGDAMYNAKVGLIAGSSQWYPVALTDTVRLSGTWNAFRGPAAPQPMGDANHCGIPSDLGPCWHWTGGAHLDLKRLAATLVLSVDKPGPVDSGTAVTFTGTAVPATIAGMAVDVSPNTRRWLSDFPGTGDTVTCTSVSGPACARTMINSGTLYMGAYVNGKEDEKWQRVEVIGRSRPNPPACRDAMTLNFPSDASYGPGGDSVTLKYPELTSAQAESLFAKLWQESNYTPDNIALRRERAGWLIQTANGGYRWQEVQPKVVTPCAIDIIPFPQLASGEYVLYGVHPHPAALNDDLNAMCGQPMQTPTYDARVDAPDMDASAQVIALLLKSGRSDAIPYFRGDIFIDANGITFYRGWKDPNGNIYKSVRLPRCGY
jgi:hypothetical protein